MALALGMTVRELLSTVDSRELAEWIAYHTHVEPIGEVRGDLRAGIVASTIANVNRKKHRAPFKAHDFMPYLKDTSQTEEQMKSAFLSAFQEVDK